MMCDTREQELLLLAHGELPLPRRIVMRAHLRRCPSCRTRYARLQQVSGTVASVVRGPSAAPWSPLLNKAGTGAWPHVTWLCVALLTLAIFAVVLTERVVLERQTTQCEHPIPRIQAIKIQAMKASGRVPDTPKDKCD